MPQNKVLEQLQENLQLVYRQAIDADNKLNGLQQAGHGKFQSVFADEQGFRTRSNRFLPYVKELAQELEEMKQQAELAPEDLQLMVKRLALLLKTLQAFKRQT
ncbi:MAG: prephenate dehydrogenase [Shewanella sp.]|nr:prephenate dehydrogenase [Shewanella sp.]MCF1430299.1 prephenate dehydrogenase [Shewanella sp.]MCF1438704.1 prephenate dehydrogenase [Shewanella sp.]MCF1459090.1 prephenate dehydrogenase [Shewanella sp.]